MSSAEITIAYKGRSIVLELDGPELSRSSKDYRYLNHASRDWIADEVEKALLNLAENDCPDCTEGTVTPTGRTHPAATQYVCSAACGWNA